MMKCVQMLWKKITNPHDWLAGKENMCKIAKNKT